ncbi:MAG: YdaS family helix-turn-helix protein [Gammaproteobacteria bacterium]
MMSLSELLHAANLTQTALAERLRISQASISKWGRGGIPLDRVLDVENVTGIPREQLAPEFFRTREQAS